jgi:kynureninase
MMKMSPMETLAEIASKLDREDELGRFRDKFCIPPHGDGSGQHYFCGHSLGLQAKSVEDIVGEDLHAWRTLAVRGHFEGEFPWMDYNDRLCRPLARLAGANPSEVVVMNTLTVNLHLLMVSFFRPQGKRRKILIEKHAFPSDRYAVESQLRFHGLDPADCMLELEQQSGERLIQESALESFLQAQGDEVALVLWPGVQYVSGQAFDLARVAAAARRAGARVGFDLAHYIGNLPLALHDSGCDFAAWCHYKYLNAGPGAVAGCFIHERHHQGVLPRFHGWWGNERESRFRMESGFSPSPGARAWQLSNPPILAMAPLRASLDIFDDAGMERLRAKSRALTAYLENGIRDNFDGLLEIITPSDHARRGCQLSMRICSDRRNGRHLHRYLEQRGVITDWREPDVIRVAPVPLYNRFEDCFALLRQVLAWSEATGNPACRSAC